MKRRTPLTRDEVLRAAESAGWVITEMLPLLGVPRTFVYQTLRGMPDVLERIQENRTRYKGSGYGRGVRRVRGPKPYQDSAVRILDGVAVGHGAVAIQVAGQWHAWSLASLMRGEL